MSRTGNQRLRPFAQDLRKGMTKQERRLWYGFLAGLPQTVHRQKVIGSYIVDFYCAQAGLVIELDGSQHYQEEGLDKDRERDAYLQKEGLTVLRFSNSDVMRHFPQVCQVIQTHLDGCTEG